MPLIKYLFSRNYRKHYSRELRDTLNVENATNECVYAKTGCEYIKR